jgi:hypothetical protein
VQILEIEEIIAVMLGASITCAQGVYPAELQAIARVLAMFPLSCHLHMHSDSESSLSAIRSYWDQCNERRRLRMAGRPLLQLIHSLLMRRVGDTSLSHVKAHTAGTDAHSVGNRLSDYQANLSRSKPDHSTPLNLLQLPLNKCEHHMFITDSAGRVLSGDIRRTAMAQLKDAELAHWNALPGAIPPGELACEAIVELGRAVLQSGKASHQSTFLHVALNSIHLFWASNGELTLLQCEDCQEPRSLGHLFDCVSIDSIIFQHETAILVRDCFGADPCTRGWLHASRRLPLRALLLSLFPLPAAASHAEQQRYFTCLLVGAFTRRQANAAAKLAGFASGEDGRACLLQLRLRCLEHVGHAFGRWKAAADRA